jgi:hypothetical protein
MSDSDGSGLAVRHKNAKADSSAEAQNIFHARSLFGFFTMSASIA